MVRLSVEKAPSQKEQSKRQSSYLKRRGAGGDVTLQPEAKISKNICIYIFVIF